MGTVCPCWLNVPRLGYIWDEWLFVFHVQKLNDIIDQLLQFFAVVFYIFVRKLNVLKNFFFKLLPIFLDFPLSKFSQQLLPLYCMGLDFLLN